MEKKRSSIAYPGTPSPAAHFSASAMVLAAVSGEGRGKREEKVKEILSRVSTTRVSKCALPQIFDIESVHKNSQSNILEDNNTIVNITTRPLLFDF